MGRPVLIAGIMAAALALGGAGCGGATDEATQAAREEFLRDLDSCEPESLPIRVNLHNSGISCADAILMRVIMADGPGPQTTGSPRLGRWVCTDLPQSRSPVLSVCRQGKKFFTFESD